MRLEKYILLVGALLTGLGIFSQTTLDTIEISKDSYVRSNSTGSNYGTSGNFYAYYNVTPYSWRGYLEADFSSIPENAIVISAELELYSTWGVSTYSHPMYLQRTEASWTETGITWSNQPTVSTSDQISVPDDDVDQNGWHSIDVKDHVQEMVNYPDLNHGWCLRVQSESGQTRGRSYHSREATSDSVPRIHIEYVFPIEIDGYTQHCTNGNSDGAIVPVVSKGSETYSSYEWFEFDGSGNTTSIESGTNISNAEVEGLDPGLYLLYVEDDEGTTGYRYFAVGEEGEETSVTIHPYHADTAALFGEDCIQSHSNADGNYGDYTYFNATDWSSYHGEAYMKWLMDFDFLLDFNQADLQLVSVSPHYHINPAGCSNGSTVSLVIEYWNYYLLIYNKKLTKDDTVTVAIPETSGNQYRNDTLDLLEFVGYWQGNPDENFGVNMALDAYTCGSNVRLIYANSDYATEASRPKFVLSFEVKPSIITEYYDSLDVGSIEINAPNGELPYHYFISYFDSIPSLDTMWSVVKDSIEVDSVDFFRGNVDNQNFTFQNLKAERYYIAVFDNNGSKLVEHEVIVGPELELLNSEDVDLTGRKIEVTSPETSGYALIDGQIPLNKSGGIEFKIETLGAFAIGMNRMDDSPANDERDMEYAMDFQSNGAFSIFVDDSIYYDDTATTGDIFRMSKVNYEMVFYQNDYEIFRKNISTDLADHYKVEVTFKGPNPVLSQVSKYDYFAEKIRPVLTKSIQTECDLNNGYLQFYPGPYFGTGGSISGSIYVYDADSLTLIDSIVFAGATPSTNMPLDVGRYKVVYTWTNNGGTTTHNWIEYHEIGNAMSWLTLDQYFVYDPGTVNTIETVNFTNNAHAVGINNWPQGDLGWVSYNTKVDKHYQQLGFGSYNSFVPYSNTRFKIVDDQGQNEIELMVFSLMGNSYVHAYDSSGTLITPVFTTYLDGPYLINLKSGSPNQFEAYYNNSSSPFATVDQSNSNSDYKVEVSAIRGSFVDTYVSFCDGVPTSEHCAHLDYELDGNYYVTKNGKLCFVYNEEYNDTLVELNIYDNASNLVATEADFTTANLVHGENRIVLIFDQFDCSDDGFYVLEVINDKGEKFYLRFYYASPGIWTGSFWTQCYTTPGDDNQSE